MRTEIDLNESEINVNEAEIDLNECEKGGDRAKRLSVNDKP